MSVPYLPLEAWNKPWQLDGSRVRCRLFNHVQDLTQAGAFTHAPYCKARTVEPQYSSRELAVLLQQKNPGRVVLMRAGTTVDTRTGPGKSNSLATFDRMTNAESFGVVDFGGSYVAGT